MEHFINKNILLSQYQTYVWMSWTSNVQISRYCCTAFCSSMLESSQIHSSLHRSFQRVHNARPAHNLISCRLGLSMRGFWILQFKFVNLNNLLIKIFWIFESEQISLFKSCESIWKFTYNSNFLFQNCIICKKANFPDLKVEKFEIRFYKLIWKNANFLKFSFFNLKQHILNSDGKLLLFERQSGIIPGRYLFVEQF